MISLLAHLTPLDAPVVWIAFAAGLLCGIAGALVVVGRRSAVRESR